MISPEDTKPGEYVYVFARQFGFREYYRQQYILVEFTGDGAALVAPTPADCARRKRQAKARGNVLRDRPEDARYRYSVEDLHRSELNT